jgi:hypothetical protein
MSIGRSAATECMSWVVYSKLSELHSLVYQKSGLCGTVAYRLQKHCAVKPLAAWQAQGKTVDE